MTFTHAYNQGSWSGAVCVASRTMLVTGRYVWHAQRDYQRTDELYRQQGRLWPQLLAQAGYHTYFSGKWHIRADAEQSFETVRHVRPGMPNQTPLGYHRPDPQHPDTWRPWDPQHEGFWKGGKHWSEVLADDAVDYLEMAEQDDRPFFMYLAFNAPHDPRQAPREYVEHYPLENIAVPPSFLPVYPLSIGCNTIRDEVLGPFPRTHHIVRVHRQEYYACITHLDAQIGRILDKLAESDMAENTYIFFTADHGLAVGNHGLMGKQNQFDHSVRVPFVVAGPDVPQDVRRTDLIYLQDVMPSTLELAQAQQPDHVQFQSLVDAWRHRRSVSREHIYGAYLEHQRMITDGKSKLILYPQIHQYLVYDLQQDPHEITDLSIYDAARGRQIARRLFTELLAQQPEVGDQLDLRAAFPELAPDAS